MLDRLSFMKEEFVDFLKNSKKYGWYIMLKDLIGINRLYLQNYYVKKILDFAKENDMKFTFFMTAKNLNKKLPAIKRMLEEGHEIGSHSYNHIAHGKRPYSRIRQEISKAQVEFKKYGIAPCGFRAPFLSMNEDVVKVLGELGFKYSSNVSGGKIFKYKNKVIEVPVVSPYDWEAFVVKGISFGKLMRLWDGKEGAFLLHPWVISKHLRKLKHAKLESGKDYRIKSNLGGGISVSFDVY